MATVTKKDLIDRIAETTRCKRAEVKRVVQCFLDHIVEELGRGNRLEFRDFGVFEIKERAARVAQNPKTLQRVPVPAKRTVKFKVGRLLKDQLDVPGGAMKHDSVAKADGARHDGAKPDRARHDGARHDGKPQVVVQPDLGTVKPKASKA